MSDTSRWVAGWIEILVDLRAKHMAAGNKGAEILTDGAVFWLIKVQSELAKEPPEVAVEGVRWCPVHRGIGGESPDDPTCDRFEFTASNDLAPKVSRMPCDLRPLFYRQEPVTEETT